MNNLASMLRKAYHRLPTPPSTNYLYRDIRPNPYEFLPPRPVIYDIGSKEIKGSYAFGAPPEDARIVCVDVAAGEGVDLVADAHDLHMVPSDSVDFVTTVSVLEHVRYPQKVISEIYRILKPGGIVYVSVPFVFPYHADPDDFYRFSYRESRFYARTLNVSTVASIAGRHRPCTTCWCISWRCYFASIVERSTA